VRVRIDNFYSFAFDGDHGFPPGLPQKAYPIEYSVSSLN
jgi:hypothetical protein